MNVEHFKESIHALFGEQLRQFADEGEYAFYDYGPEEIKRIGYCTNMTPEIVRQAEEKRVDLILTHHDAWDFVYSMKEACHALLEEHRIHHFFVHLPLDYAEFGTCGSLFRLIGITEGIRHSYHHQDGRSIPGVGEFAYAVTFEELIRKVETAINEDVKAWQNSDRPIKKVGILTGAGNSTTDVREAVQAGCDAYITGEKTLYTVQYAQFVGMNLIVGSHSFMELPGVKSLAEQLQEKFPDLEIVELQEQHLE